MEVERFEDASTFREVVDPFLLEDEAVNNLILGVSGTVIVLPDAYDEFSSWVVIEGGVPVAAAIRTPPHRLILGLSKLNEALRLLAAETGQLPGVVGCLPGVEVFVEARPEVSVLNMTQGVFQLDHVEPPRPAGGVSRPGRPDEFDAALEMRLAFEEEAIGSVEDPDMSRRSTRERLEEQSPLFGLWVHEVHGQVVAISGHSGPTPNGIRIGPVYTPPAFRGRGYASNLVAAESQWLLDAGRRFCFLYTDLANPTSNSIYEKIGYRQVARSAEYSLSQST